MFIKTKFKYVSDDYMNFGQIARNKSLNMSVFVRDMLQTQCSDLWQTIYLYLYLPADGAYKLVASMQFIIRRNTIQLRYSDYKLLKSVKPVSHY